MQNFLAEIKQVLLSIANAEKAVPMQAYMKNQFPFLGIAMPVRRSVFKEYLKINPIENVATLASTTKALWQLPEREFQYCAIDLLLVNHKLWNEEIMYLFEELVCTKSWWYTVDGITYDCMGKYFKLYPQKIEKITSQ